MKLLSWSCWGLGNPCAVRALRQLIKVHCPDIVFLMETKLSEIDKNVPFKLCSDILPNYLLVNCSRNKGKRYGGLAMIWKDDVKLTIINQNHMSIDCYVSSYDFSSNWRAIGVYGYPYTSQKKLTCNFINSLSNDNHSDRWLIFGDFNLIVNNSEKIGGNPIEQNLSDYFQNTLAQNDLK